mmetsp:Transcript_24690/g.69306  ORF Transcript_24690/g.69306 Transcript_24690/m.69306 type:complete len:264 (-) Transcript_24690:85-876(-)
MHMMKNANLCVFCFVVFRSIRLQIHHVPTTEKARAKEEAAGISSSKHHDLESLWKAWDGSWNEVAGCERGNSEHGQTSVLQLLHGHVLLLLVVHLLPVAGPVKGGLLVDLSGEGLAFHLSAVLDSLDDGAEHDELGPPLRIGLEEGVDWVGGVNRSVEGSELLWEDPSDGGEHGGASVGQFSLSEVVDWRPLGQLEWVEHLASGLWSRSTESVQLGGVQGGGRLGLGGRCEGTGASDGRQQEGKLHGDDGDDDVVCLQRRLCV